MISGMPAPIVYRLGAIVEQENSDPKSLLLAGILLIAGGTIGGFLGYGIYGTLHDRGWPSWKAGMASGFLGGIGTTGLLVAASLITGRPLLPPMKEKT